MKYSQICCAIVFSIFSGLLSTETLAFDNQINYSRPVDLIDIAKSMRSNIDDSSNNTVNSLILEAIKLIGNLDFSRASTQLNQGLKLDPTNANLHFLNALTYHMMARKGDVKKTELAIEGYKQSVNFDPSNVNAYYFLGNAYFESRNFQDAQSSFANALILRPDDTEIAMRLVAASYMAGDPTTSCAVTNKVLNSIDRKNLANKQILKISIPVFSSCKNFDLAKKYLAELKLIDPKEHELQMLDSRINGWKIFFDSQPALLSQNKESQGKFIKTADESDKKEDDKKDDVSKKPGCGDLSGLEEKDRNRMVLIDVVMLRTEDNINTTKGVNLMNGLSLLFGTASAATQGVAYSKSFLNVDGNTTITRGITIPALTYSMNIADANTSLTEVLAKPSLTTMECKKSEFFSGTQLTAAVVSGGVGGGSVSIEKSYGVRLGVTTEIIEGNQVRMKVDASRTFLQPPSNNIAFTYKVEISEIQASANVVLRLGDTLILGGLSETETDNIRDGVPVLQDTPGLQYLFSQEKLNKFNRSVLMLITPRPASYTYLSEATRDAIDPNNPFSPSVNVLRARYVDWFEPFPNLSSVFNMVNQTNIYREFRTGDVTLEKWDRMNSTKFRLQQALDFLHY
jgi:general secretion pathway protein D